MPRFLVVHTGPFTEEMFKSLAQSETPEGLTWKHTYCDFKNNKFFCEWDSPGKEHLENYFQEGGLPFDDVYQVRLFNVARADFE